MIHPVAISLEVEEESRLGCFLGVDPAIHIHNEYTIDVDDALSDTSINPVENCVVTKALDDVSSEVLSVSGNVLTSVGELDIGEFSPHPQRDLYIDWSDDKTKGHVHGTAAYKSDCVLYSNDFVSMTTGEVEPLVYPFEYNTDYTIRFKSSNPNIKIHLNINDGIDPVTRETYSDEDLTFTSPPEGGTLEISISFEVGEYDDDFTVYIRFPKSLVDIEKDFAEVLDDKVDKINGKGLSTEDYTAAEKEKLSGIEVGAQKNPDLSGYATTEALTALSNTYKPVEKTSAMTQAVGKDASGKLWTAPGSGGGGSITVDTELSSESENPVQNKVINEAFDNLKSSTNALEALPIISPPGVETLLDDGEYTDEAKIALQKALGVWEPPWELVNDITLTEEGRIDLTADDDGTSYNLRGAFIMVHYPANTPTASTGYGRYYAADEKGQVLASESSRYGSATYAASKFYMVLRQGPFALMPFSVTTADSSRMTWTIKHSGFALDFGNITRIYMNANDVEPAGTNIKIYAQRAY